MNYHDKTLQMFGVLRECVAELKRQNRDAATKAAEVVAELRELQKTAKRLSVSLFVSGADDRREHAGAAVAFENAADLVAAKLGVK